MRIVALFLECLFVFLFIPLLGMELWKTKANSLVQKGDTLLMSNPKEAVLLYQKAEIVCFGSSKLASNRLRVCKSYGIGLDGVSCEEHTRSVFRDRSGNIENEPTFEREYPGGRRKFSDRWADKACANLSMEETTYDLPNEVINNFKEKHPASEYLYSYNEQDEPFRYRMDNLTLATKTLNFLRSLEKMPRLEDNCERKLWEDSSESPKVRRVLIARIHTLAEDGCLWAQKEYALCFQNGDYTQQSEVDAFKWYLNAAKQGDATAAIILACRYRDGRGVEKNKSEMVSWLREASKYGDADAEFLLAQCYEGGNGVSKNEKVALELYRSAATRGHVKACALLGFRLINSTDAKEKAQAFNWLEIASAGGDMKASTYVGICYYEGKGVKKDVNKAYALFLGAAYAGNIDAQFWLGQCYCSGDGVEVNVKKGFSWIEKAAEGGHVSALKILGNCYRSGLGGVKQDRSLAFKWDKKAAEMGDVTAMAYVGISYATGVGVAKNEIEAAKWLHIAIENMNSTENGLLRTCQLFLGQLYLYGEGVSKDEKKAFHLFLDAANNGLSEAQYWVGFCYEKGFGVVENAYIAFTWYKKAATQNDESGQCAVARCYLFGEGVTRDVEEGYKWAKKSAVQGFVAGQLLLGICYENGYGKEGNVPNRPDKAKALVWYRKAAEQGNEIAKEKVRSLSSRNYNW